MATSEPTCPVTVADPQRLADFLETISSDMLTDEAVRAIGLEKDYRMGTVIVRALAGIDLTVARGTYLSIMGPSGSGKTTLFNMVGGLDKPSQGQVFVDGVGIAELDPVELAWLRSRKIGYVFQTFNLIGTMTALENVMLPMSFAGFTADEALDRGVEILTRVGLGDRCMHKPSEMSGGQQQRVAIARAFANDPAIILADEPTGNLDLNTGQEIILLLKQLNRDSGVTVISATHDHKMLDVSDRIVWMADGRIERTELRKDIDIEVGRIEE